MTYAVLSTPAEHRAILRAFFGDGQEYVSGGRAYLLLLVNDRVPDQVLCDAADGEVLCESRTFDDEASAQRWIANDVALRAAQTQGVQ